MITLETYSIDLIFESINRFKYGKYKISRNSLRLQCFKRNPCCVCCGIKGTIIKLQKHCKTDGSPFFNLYAERNDGSLVLMTKDHIIPVYLGGENVLSNLQTMCEWCNNAKGINILTSDAVDAVKQEMPHFNSLCKASAKQRITKIIKSKCFYSPIMKDLYEIQSSYY